MMRLPREPVRASDRGVARAPEAVTPATAPGLMLALQGSAGNRAVSSLVAREDATTAPTPADAKTEQRTAASVTIPGVGTVKVQSFSFVQASGTIGKNPDANEGPKEIDFVSRTGEHTAKLHALAIDGTSVGDVDVAVSGFGLIHLKAAAVTGYSAGGGDPSSNDAIEQWTLSAARSTFERK